MVDSGETDASAGRASPESLPAPKQAENRSMPAASRSVAPAAAIAVGGGLIFVGSLLSWANGDFLFSLVSLQGTELLEGNVTFLIGAAVGLLGLIAMRTGGGSAIRLAVAVLALASLAIVAYVFGTLAQRLEGWVNPTIGIGLVAVAVGGVLAAVGALKIKRP